MTKNKIFLLVLSLFISMISYSNEIKIKDLLIKEYDDPQKFRHSGFYKLHFLTGNNEFDYNNYYESNTKISFCLALVLFLCNTQDMLQSCAYVRKN